MKITGFHLQRPLLFHSQTTYGETHSNTYQIDMGSIRIIENRNDFLELGEYLIMPSHIRCQYAPYDALAYETENIK